jgi:hypothetical protein
MRVVRDREFEAELAIERVRIGEGLLRFVEASKVA